MGYLAHALLRVCTAGLESRFPNILRFPDYDAENLFKIAEKMVSDKDQTLSDDARNALFEKCIEIAAYPQTRGNARGVPS